VFALFARTEICSFCTEIGEHFKNLREELPNLIVIFKYKGDYNVMHVLLSLVIIFSHVLNCLWKVGHVCKMGPHESGLFYPFFTTTCF